MSGNTFFKLNQTFDSLTGLYDRAALVDYAKQLVAAGKPFSLAIIDIDNFKNVNDTYGHTTGDKIICGVADKIKELYSGKGIVGRFGGDEFLVILEGITDYDEVWAACHYVFKSVENLHFDLPPEIFITFTQGVSRFGIDGDSYESLLETADKALYRGKQKGRKCFIIYLAEKHANIKLRTSEETAVSSMQLHSEIFNILTERKPVRERIAEAMKSLNSRLMIDHIVTQSLTKNVLSEVYSLSKVQEVPYIPGELIKDKIDPATGIYFFSGLNRLNEESEKNIIDVCKRDKVVSCLFVEIRFGETLYGYLRCEMAASYRIWQYSDMDLILTAARVIGMVLFYNKVTLDEI